jgi:hypothetical protein
MQNLESLEKELTTCVRHYERRARQNYVVLYVLYIVSILASAAATILVAIGKSGPLLAIVTALPGIAILANNSLKLQARSLWHYEKTRRLTSLFRELRDERSSRDLISKKLDDLEEEMDKTWPGWGEVPTKPVGSGG